MRERGERFFDAGNREVLMLVACVASVLPQPPCMHMCPNEAYLLAPSKPDLRGGAH
jgi:hypothetical protein